MNRKKRIGLVVAAILLTGCLFVSSASAQEHAQPTPQAQSAEQKSQRQPVNPDTAASRDLVKESTAAEHSEEGEAHDMHDAFKYSSMVQRMGRWIGLDAHGMYWLSLVLNFVILAAFFWILLKAKVPQMFRDRTNTIQKALKEAQDARAEAQRRLADIEARLAKLDSEVNNIRAEAEREAAAEEERIRATAEDDKRKVVDAAQTEIAAIARSARHELKSFAASLAVDMAARKIKVDDTADEALVRQFTSHLGKDGQ